MSTERARERQREISFKELAHTIMEVKKSHDLPSASKIPGKVSGIIHSESIGLRTRGADSLNLSPRWKETKVPAQAGRKAEKRMNFPFLCLFSLFKPSV